MSVKLSRYVFRKIGGRIIPIRIGAEKATNTANYSMKASKKLGLLLQDFRARFSKTMKLIKSPDSSGSDQMVRFMKKTGSIRVSGHADNLMVDAMREPTSKQIKTLKDMAVGKKYIYGDNEEFGSINGMIKKIMNLPSSPKTKIADKLDDIAISRYGETHNPNVAGYINREGKMLNFSGGGYGERYLDHRDVSSFVPRPRNLLLKQEEMNKMISRIAQGNKIERSKSHDAFKHYSDILKIKEIKKGEDLYPFKGEFIRSHISFLKRDKQMGSKSASKWLNKLKNRNNK